jgi:hypothetical protein
MAPMRSVVIGPKFDNDVYMSHVVGEREYVIIDLMQLIWPCFLPITLKISSPSLNISMMLVFLRRVVVELKFGKWGGMVPLLTCRGIISSLGLVSINCLGLGLKIYIAVVSE